MDSQGEASRQRHGEPCRVPVPHHLLVNLKSFTYNSIGEDTDIFFSLFDLREGRTIRWETLPASWLISIISIISTSTGASAQERTLKMCFGV